MCKGDTLFLPEYPFLHLEPFSSATFIIMWLQRYLKNNYDIEFPTQEQLENLRYYKYAAVDKSYVTKYILSHYWNWAITLFPMWIA